MTARLADYIEAGYALPPDERLEAARMLRLGVEQETDSERAEIDAAWDEVLDRRVAEVVNGTASVVDGAESLAQIRIELAAHRT